ncbi:MAG: preprotein translocase subunit SecG [Candidatus Bipolaricaulota bacterium]|nr:preprotein translocase subunit SecG [Candidatus Bipolaricaulota bacterium]MCX7844036.1 preprotein translocase subunit SecG [Candidatus Bipolaricaulota bacterium]MDW8151978.1 preprotein translocase subunit SecG [Candidatus Bipolaricaulota bacterium]
MGILRSVLLALFFLDSFALIALVLLHMSEHATLGGAFGSGMAATVFGRDVARDPKKLLIGILGALFFVLGILLAVL